MECFRLWRTEDSVVFRLKSPSLMRPLPSQTTPFKIDVCERFLQKHHRKIVEDSYGYCGYYTFVSRGAEPASNSWGRWSSLGDSAAACQKGILHVARPVTVHWYTELALIGQSSFAGYTYNIILHHRFWAQQKPYLQPGYCRVDVLTVY